MAQLHAAVLLRPRTLTPETCPLPPSDSDDDPVEKSPVATQVGPVGAAPQRARAATAPATGTSSAGEAAGAASGPSTTGGGAEPEEEAPAAAPQVYGERDALPTTAGGGGGLKRARSADDTGGTADE